MHATAKLKPPWKPVFLSHCDALFGPYPCRVRFVPITTEHGTHDKRVVESKHVVGFPSTPEAFVCHPGRLSGMAEEQKGRRWIDQADARDAATLHIRLERKGDLAPQLKNA